MKIVRTVFDHDKKVETPVLEQLANVRVSDRADMADYGVVAGDVSVSFWFGDEQRSKALQRLRNDLKKYQAEVERAEKQLANKKFVERAPKEKVASEREKMRVNTAQVEEIQSRLSVFGQ